jgi:hypothetical protein
MRGEALEPCLARARAAPHVDHVGAVPAGLQHLRDELGQVLQVGVDQQRARPSA